MRNLFKLRVATVRQRNVHVMHLGKDDIMTGYLSEEIHKKLRSLNKKRNAIH